MWGSLRLAPIMDDATELRSFLSKDLFDWLQGSDALDACDALLLSASDVYENLHTDHTPSLRVPPIPRPPSPTTGTTTHYEYTLQPLNRLLPSTCTGFNLENAAGYRLLYCIGKLIIFYIHGNMLYLLIRQHEKHCNS